MKFFKLLVILSSIITLSIVKTPCSGQIVRVGLKGGSQMSWVNYDEPEAKKALNVTHVVGFSGGAVVSFKVKNRYFLHTEYLFTTKGRKLTGTEDPDFEDEATHYYAEIPVMFTMHFKGKIGKERTFKWFLGAGPNFGYWLGGKGRVVSGDILEAWPHLDYTIKFGERTDHSHPDHIYVEDANRFQWGLNVGAGILFEPVSNHKVMLDFRYEWGHTRLGKTSADYMLPALFDDDMRARSQSLRVSLLYLFEFNLDPKSRNKGKSTIKR